MNDPTDPVGCVACLASASPDPESAVLTTLLILSSGVPPRIMIGCLCDRHREIADQAQTETSLAVGGLLRAVRSVDN